MTLKECLDWLAAAGQCLPGARLGRLRRALPQVETACGRGRWQIGLSSDGLASSAAVRFFGSPRGARGRRALASRWLRRAGALGAVPGMGLPWLELEWSLRRDEPAAAWLYSACPGGALARGGDGSSRKTAPRPFSSDWLEDEAISTLLRDFAARCPVESLLLEFRKAPGEGWRQSPRWGLRLSRPEPWPRFARLGLSDPYAAQASRLAYLAGQRRVHEVVFEGGALSVFIGA